MAQATGSIRLASLAEGEVSEFGALDHRSNPRFIERNRPFGQSRNRVNVKHNHGIKIYTLLRHDWFHVLLRRPAWQSVSMLLTTWTVFIIIFASLYVWVDNQNPQLDCGLGPAGSPIEFAGAFAFSLETCTTVGYGLPNSVNAFFEVRLNDSECLVNHTPHLVLTLLSWIDSRQACPSVHVTIYFQMMWSMMFNAFLFAFFYSGMAKAEARGAQVALSKKAIVSVVDGQIRFQVRVYDMDAAHPIVEAHVRMYAVTKGRPVPRPLRMLQPNDELNSMLLLSVPTVMAHDVDLYSTLHPPVDTPVRPSGLILRTVDSETCNREEVVCPICGESYGTYERWRTHVLYQRIIEAKDEFPVQKTHLSIDEADLLLAHQKKPPPAALLKEIESYFKSEISEVICVVEGIEPIVSGTFSALQSYCFEDIVFHPGAHFSACVEAMDTKSNTSTVRVDLDRFHTIDLDDTAAENFDIRHGKRRKNQRSLRVHDAFFKKSADE